MAHAEAAEFLHAVHEELACQSDLSPENPKVNSCLNRLVATLQAWHQSGFGAALPDHPDFSKLASALPRLCARAECEMEKWWCARILASNCRGAQALTAFWYLDHYRALCRAELDLLGTAAGGRFVFLGSGALPLTAILMAQHLEQIEVTCVDCDEEASFLAGELVSLLGLSRQIRIKPMDANVFRPAADETVICASLLDAPGIFRHLEDCRIRRLIVRDAEGPYRFCYLPARLPGPAFSERAKSPLSAQRINTSRYFEASN